MIPADKASFMRALDHLIDIGLAFWAGYEEIVLIAALFLRRWTVIISPRLPLPPTGPTDRVPSEKPLSEGTPEATQKALVRVFPRRWLDIHGHKMADVWVTARQAVMGIIVFHPGISQASIVQRLRVLPWR